MKTAILVFKRTYQSALGLIGIFFIASFSGCFQMRMSESDAKQYFSKQNCAFEFCRYQIYNHTINYVKTGVDTLPLVVFVHGAPGSWDNFKSLLSDSLLLTKAKMISVDRPGYGYSDFGCSVTSISKQAELLFPVLTENHSKSDVILVGHSYGGPIIAKMAMDNPEKIKALVLAAPAVDPRNEVYYWVTKPADMAAFRWILPKVFRVANDEKINHASELYTIYSGWEAIKSPVTTLHGTKDKLVPVVNSYFVEKMLVNCPEHRVIRDKGNHLIPFNRPEMIKDAILYYLDSN